MLYTNGAAGEVFHAVGVTEGVGVGFGVDGLVVVDALENAGRGFDLSNRTSSTDRRQSQAKLQFLLAQRNRTSRHPARQTMTH